MTLQKDYIFVLPTLKTAGGNLEVIRLADEVIRSGKTVAIVSLWRTANPINPAAIPVSVLFDRPLNRVWAFLSIPWILFAFSKVLRDTCSPTTKVVFTHYATYIPAPLLPKRQRWFFVQALEWYFVPAGPLRTLLRAFILKSYRKGHVLAANRFLRRSLEAKEITVSQTADIWADPFFAAEGGVARDIDVTLMFRKGIPKRADWGAALLNRLRADRPGLRITVISPDEEFADMAGPNGIFLLRPSREDILHTYQRSRVFILFSDHEGFGLPPLEGMGSGCVPLCRDAGGVRAYMEPDLEANILPLQAPPEDMAHRLYEILDDSAEWSRLSAVAKRVFSDGLNRAANRFSALENCGFINRQMPS